MRLVKIETVDKYVNPTYLYDTWAHRVGEGSAWESFTLPRQLADWWKYIIYHSTAEDRIQEFLVEILERYYGE